MPTKKTKKKTQVNSSRGFATTSVPAKPKTVSRPVSPVPLQAADEQGHGTLESQDVTPNPIDAATGLVQENSEIVEAGSRIFAKLCTESDVEKRARKTSIQLSLPEELVERILRLGKGSLARPRTETLSGLDTLKNLYAGELLLRKLGIDAPLVNEILSSNVVIGATDVYPQHLVLTTPTNVQYEKKPSRMITNEEDESLETSPTISRRPSRMTELLSDEEDQTEIELDPTMHYIQTRLQVLSLRSMAKKEPQTAASILRLEKRLRVIESQLGFDRKMAAEEVKRRLKAGYMMEAQMNTPSVSVQVCNPKVRDSSEDDASDSDSGDGWLSTQKLSTTDSSEGSESPKIRSDAIDIMEEASSMLPDLDDTAAASELIPDSLFSLPEPDSVPHSQTSAQVPSPTRQIFPLTLPKSSQNISPVKLLQTFLKRADKSAKDIFDLERQTLLLRFSSSKVDRRTILVEDTKYSFPDDDTAKNFLSMKALFSVPELASEKAGTRFSGDFRKAWQLLEDAEEEVKRALIASKVQNARQIFEHRQHVEYDDVNSNSANPATDYVVQQTSNRHGHGPCSEETIFQMWDDLYNSEAYARMYEYRATLPIAAYRHALLDAIASNQVTILCGETGCGKSTQLPTFILEQNLAHANNCKIYVTEPRRISAISLATRVSAELGEPKHAIAHSDSLLGFSIRLDSQVSEKSRLIYATTGIVLRMLEDNSDLGGITHLILDEVHERSIESDFLLIVVKRLLQHRRDLRVVLMSATLDSERFNEYFGGHCCIFHVPGRTYPVDQHFLEDAIELSQYVCEENSFYAKRFADTSSTWEIPDEQEESLSEEQELITYSERTIKALQLLDPYKINYDLICALLDHLEKNFDRSMTKAILIFLPGMGEIRRLLDTLQAHRTFGDYQKWVIYALHSSIANDKQQAAFDVPPRGMRKIVIATNIAETGITIPDITCVIDAGKHKESRFDARRQLNKLVETYISKANARQRMGRAGRVQPGVCFHLFSKARYDKMAEHQLPEFQRLNLDDLALRVKTVRMGGIEEVLLEALDAPTPENVRRSINSLIEVGALDDNQNLTALGRHLAKLPVDITLGKLILYGVRYSCLDPCLVIAASLSSKSPFETSLGQEREANSAKQVFIRGESDFLTVWTAYTKWKTVCIERPKHETKFCRDSCLSSKSLNAIEELRVQYIKILADSGLLGITDSEKRAIQRARFVSSRDGFIELPPEVCANVRSQTIIELCLASAFYPNLINVQEGFRTIAKGQSVTLHPSSINYHNSNFSKRWITFFGLLKTKTATHAHDTGLVDDYIVALFCGTQFEVRPYAGTISIDHNRIRFMTRDLRTLIAIQLLRENLDKQFAAFLDRQPVKNEWLDILQDVVQTFEAVAKQKLK